MAGNGGPNKALDRGITLTPEMLKRINQPKHRYFHATGPAEHIGDFCMKLEDEGFEILSVSDFVMAHQQGISQLSGITARISRDLPLTKTEQELVAEANQLVKPVKGRIVT
jgi:hypothetical protein